MLHIKYERKKMTAIIEPQSTIIHLTVEKNIFLNFPSTEATRRRFRHCQRLVTLNEFVASFGGSVKKSLRLIGASRRLSPKIIAGL